MHFAPPHKLRKAFEGGLLPLQSRIFGIGFRNAAMASSKVLTCAICASVRCRMLLENFVLECEKRFFDGYLRFVGFVQDGTFRYAAFQRKVIGYSVLHRLESIRRANFVVREYLHEFRSEPPLFPQELRCVLHTVANAGRPPS